MEMVKMLHYDALLDASDSSDKKSSSSASYTPHLAYLKEHPLEAVDNDSLAKVKLLQISVGHRRWLRERGNRKGIQLVKKNPLQQIPSVSKGSPLMASIPGSPG